MIDREKSDLLEAIAPSGVSRFVSAMNRAIRLLQSGSVRESRARKNFVQKLETRRDFMQIGYGNFRVFANLDSDGNQIHPEW